MRYKFYREHKYISHRCNEFERLIATTDFSKKKEFDIVEEEFEDLMNLLKRHAEYENDSLHSLLKIKNSAVYKNIEKNHEGLEKQIIFLRELLNKISNSISDEDKIEAGYQLYLHFRRFNGENLIHLHEEETIILPELHRLYSDEELKKVEAAFYATMTTEELIEMIEELFPHMNPDDWAFFLSDIKDAVPEKFMEVWPRVKFQMDEKQQEDILRKLNII